MSRGHRGRESEFSGCDSGWGEQIDFGQSIPPIQHYSCMKESYHYMNSFLFLIWIVKKEKKILKFQLKWRDYAAVFANQAAWPKSAPIESVCTNIQLQAKEELFLQVPQSKYNFYLIQQAGIASFFTLKPSLGVTC